jgi:hypothetical protein
MLTMRDELGMYAYCVIAAGDAPPPCDGVDPSYRTKVVVAGRLGAVTKEVPLTEFSGPVLGSTARGHAVRGARRTYTRRDCISGARHRHRVPAASARAAGELDQTLNQSASESAPKSPAPSDLWSSERDGAERQLPRPPQWFAALRGTG